MHIRNILQIRNIIRKNTKYKLQIRIRNIQRIYTVCIISDNIISVQYANSDIQTTNPQSYAYRYTRNMLLVTLIIIAISS